MLFFQKLYLKTDFLEIPVEQWHSNLNFQEAKATVQALPVVSDHAERGVALIQEYSGRLTEDEQMQFLLQVVAEHRKVFPNALKQTLLSNSQ